MSVWTQATGLSAYLLTVTWKQIVWGGGQFVAMGQDPTTFGLVIATSPDGNTWTQRTVPAVAPYTTDGVAGLAYGAGIFVGLGTAAFATWNPGNTTIPTITSTDGITWTVSHPNVSGATFGGVNPQTDFCSFVNGDFCSLFIDGAAPSGKVLGSADGLAWSVIGVVGAFSSSDVQGGVAYNGTVYSVKAQGDAWTGASLNALTHHTIVGSGEAIDGMTWGTGLFGTFNYSIGGFSNLYSSPDGATWTGHFGPTGVNLTGPTPDNVQYGNGQFYLSESDDLGNSRLFTTTDFVTWAEDTLPGPAGFASPQIIAFGTTALAKTYPSTAGRLQYLNLGPALVTVPNVVGLSQLTASIALTSATLTVGPVTFAHTSVEPAGLVAFQVPVAGSMVVAGTPVALTVSLGPPEIPVPNLRGLTAAQAEATLAGDGLTTGNITGAVDPAIPIGSVATQNPAAGTLVLSGTAVDIGISFIVPEFDVDATVISQYANSPTILTMVADFAQWFDPAVNLQSFYLDVWNIDTAIGFGLDIWGIILQVSRVIPIPGTSGAFGFFNADVPLDWQDFGNPLALTAGGPFFAGQVVGNSYRLNDGPYRTLLLTKALANICATTAPALNALITNLFKGRGRCYTQDLGAMQMAYVFEFALTQIELAILNFSGVLAHPAGVGVTVRELAANDFGFQEALPGVKPFNFGIFFGG